MIEQNYASRALQLYKVLNTDSIIEGLISRYSNEDGFLAREVDVTSGRILDARHNLGDLGDYVQYVYYLGKARKNDAWLTWAENQVTRSILRIKKDRGVKIAPFPSTGMTVYSNLNGDYVWGLLSTFLLDPKPAIQSVWTDYLQAISTFSSLKDGYVSYGGAIIAGRTSINLPISNTLIHGQIAEPLLHLFLKYGDTRHLNAAKACMASWMPRNASCENYLRGRVVTNSAFSLLDTARRSLLGKPSRKYSFAKGNTFFIAPLIILNSIEGGRHSHLIERWLDLVTDQVCNSASDLSIVDLNSILEVLLDYLHHTESTRAHELSTILHKHLSARTNECDLLQSGAPNACHIDHQTDFAINLLKMATKFKNEAYFDTAERIISEILTRFRAPHGYFQLLDLKSRVQRPSVNPKYLGLMLKIPIALEKLANGSGLYDDVTTRNLLSDR